MILAAAQTTPKRGDITHNLEDHYRLTELAAGHGAELIVFPELSITGYEVEAAPGMAFSRNDTRLGHLQSLSTTHNIIIIAGAPVKIGEELYLGSFVLQPDGSTAVYTKQFLHPGEEAAFEPSFDYNPVLRLGDEQISLAICADIDHAEHAENARSINSTLYIPSIFFSPKGIPEAHRLLSGYAKKHSMQVLMSNYGGPSWGMDSGGRSAFWDKNGDLLAEMPAAGEGLLIVSPSGAQIVISGN